MKAALHTCLLLIDKMTRFEAGEGYAVGDSIGTVPERGITQVCGRARIQPSLPLFLTAAPLPEHPDACPDSSTVKAQTSWDLISCCCGLPLYSGGEYWLVCFTGFVKLLAFGKN